MSNNQFAYICDRIQKITEAVYRVTDLLQDKEPMKWAVREKSVSVFTALVSLRNNQLLDKNAQLEKIENLIDQLNALLCLFSESKTISSVNFDILRDEYQLAKQLISKQKQSQDFVKLSLPEPISTQASLPISRKREEPKSIGQDNGHNNANRHNIGQDESNQRNFGEERLEKKAISKPAQIKKKPTINSNRSGRRMTNTKGLARKDKILSIIKDKKEVSIGELSGLFKECSEKTIQRDLLEMVEKGVLKKEGHKRWRRYMVANS